MGSHLSIAYNKLKKPLTFNQIVDLIFNSTNWLIFNAFNKDF